MNILAIESSAQSAGAAVLYGDTLLSEQFVNNGLTHSQTLLPLIDAALSAAGKRIGDMDAVAVSAGPGSFTGVRIGMGTAKGLALGADLPLIPVPTLLGLAHNAAAFGGVIVPIMDARRGEVYTATYYAEGGALEEITPMRAMSLSQLLTELDTALFVGDGVPVHKAVIRETMGDAASFAPAHLLYHRAASVAMAARHIPPVSPHEAEPFYLRLSQAEREYNEKKNQ
ncbi:MAG: tRNA (adenosine(37)-N6)-threonylcarbamoyltransferase complex dimerization subunit type 1 TsaB [Clostridia bacterium]|nr:tRNA (adenosine(37)-N6)-threonylcarbamoyltransferase complex dimerization subunit type 1 TsaB [Clostridia bacterium]